ncbi:MAG TPA: hypothetical protein VFY71_17240 [Planctomycetota bacterium]|nr:hypothetical protein [Planctomycetota bacterium]
MTCPTFAELLAARERPAAQPEVVAHVGGCRECSRLWVALGLLPDAPRAAAWPDVGASLHETARRAGAGRVRAAPTAVASVIFDSATGARPAVALRGAGPAARHLVLASGPLQLDLALLADAPDGGDTLVGQVAGLRDAAAASCLLAGAAGARWTPLEGNGDFRFDRVSPGRYLLSIENDDQRLLVPDLDLSTLAPRDPLR